MSNLSERRHRKAPAPIAIPPPPRPKRSLSAAPLNRQQSSRPTIRKEGAVPLPTTPKSKVDTPVISRRRNGFDDARPMKAIPPSVLLAPPVVMAPPTPPAAVPRSTAMVREGGRSSSEAEMVGIEMGGGSMPPVPKRAWTSPCHRPHAGHSVARAVPGRTLPSMPMAIDIEAN